MDSGLTGPRRGKMLEKWGKWPKNGSKMAILPSFGHFAPLFPGWAKSHCSAILSPFWAGGPKWGQNEGNRDRKAKLDFETFKSCNRRVDRVNKSCRIWIGSDLADALSP